MRFTFELYDDKEFKHEECHKLCHVVCGDIERAWNRVRELYPNTDEWFIYQVCRPFDDCELPQPVFDEFNGFMFSHEAINKARRWSEIFHWDEEAFQKVNIRRAYSSII